jgi:broad specificity phosphatase PhoE
MKIYILRHEERTTDATFFSPLTEKGLINANNLCRYLELLGITTIYCSPYIRTMQTIYPFSKKSNIKLNLDYNLIEIQHPDIIPPKSYNVELPKYIANEFNYNPDYISKLNTNNIVYPENVNQLELRTKHFLKYIINEYYKTNEVILIVTHQGLCNVILQIVNKYGSSESKQMIKDDIKNNIYEYGKISLIFDKNNWTYKKIN